MVRLGLNLILSAKQSGIFCYVYGNFVLWAWVAFHTYNNVLNRKYLYLKYKHQWCNLDCSPNNVLLAPYYPSPWAFHLLQIFHLMQLLLSSEKVDARTKVILPQILCIEDCKIVFKLYGKCNQCLTYLR